MAIDDPQGISCECRPCLPLNRASDSAGRHRPRTEDRFDPPEQITQILHHFHPAQFLWNRQER